MESNIMFQNGIASGASTNLITLTPEQIEELVDNAAKRAVSQDREALREILQDIKPQRLLSSKEAADRLGVTIKTLSYWKKTGKLIPVEIGGRNRYKESVIDNWINR